MMRRSTVWWPVSSPADAMRDSSFGIRESERRHPADPSRKLMTA
jgi:hypothetical protein